MSIWAAWSPDWALYDKVDFDGVNKIIYVHPEVTTLDIRGDVYTSWVDWVALRDNLKFLPAIRTTGLDSIGGGVYTGDVYFLINGWKLSVDLQKVKVTGVLYSDDYDTAYYTPSLVPQYPATVSALVNTVSVSGSTGGSGPTAAQIRAEIDANSVKLNSIKNTVDLLPTTSGATLSQIESQTVLAKASQIQTVQAQINNLPSSIRSELTPELTHLMTLENQTSGLTSAQATMLLEMYQLLGLDPTRPLIVTQTQRTAGAITQNISASSTETVVVRV